MTLVIKNLASYFIGKRYIMELPHIIGGIEVEIMDKKKGQLRLKSVVGDLGWYAKEELTVIRSLQTGKKSKMSITNKEKTVESFVSPIEHFSEPKIEIKLVPFEQIPIAKYPDNTHPFGEEKLASKIKSFEVCDPKKDLFWKPLYAEFLRQVKEVLRKKCAVKISKHTTPKEVIQLLEENL